MKSLLKWYLEQTKQGKILIAIAIFMLVYFLVVKVVYSPWKEHLSSIHNEVVEKLETVSFMTQQVQKNKRLIQQGLNKEAPTGASHISLITLIERSAKQKGLYSSIQRISPDSKGRVKVWSNNINFQVWLTWVERLESLGIDIHSVRFNQMNTDEKVSMVATYQKKR